VDRRLGIAAVLLLLAAPATARADVVVKPFKATGQVSLGASFAGRVPVAARKASAPASKVRLYLSPTRTRGKRSVLLLGELAAPRIAKGRTATAAGSAAVPETVGTGSRYLLACAGANCTAARGRVKVVSRPPREAFDLLATAALTPAARALAEVQDVTGVKRLPARLRGAGFGLATSQAFADAAAALPTASPAERARLLRFLVPPGARGSWASSAKPARAAQGGLDCGDLTALDPEWAPPISAAGGKVKVWYRKRAPGDRADAQRYAREITTQIYPKFKALMGREPPSDAGQGCFHGGDGALDVWIQPIRGESPSADLTATDVGSDNAAGFASSYPAAQATCPNASFVVVQPGQPRWTLAHELFHSFQFAFPSAECAREPGFLKEGTATWAGDYVYRRDHRDPAVPEHTKAYKLLSVPEGPFAQSGYHAWAFYRYLSEKAPGRASLIRTIFERAATSKAIDAVDAAIPGGFRERYREFTRFAWNHEPLTDDFASWDEFRTEPVGTKLVQVKIGADGNQTRTPLPERGSYAPLSRAYFRVKVDKAVRWLRFDNPYAGNPAFGVQALVSVNGKFKSAFEELSDEKERTWCRDKADENVDQLIVMISQRRPGTTDSPPLAPTVTARAKCKDPGYGGTFSGRADYKPEAVGDDGRLVANWTGSVTFEPLDDGLEGANAMTRYRVTDGSLTYKAEGRLNGCDVTAEVSFRFPVPENTGGGELVVYAGEEPEYQLLVGVPLSKTPMGTRSNCEDETQNGQFLFLWSAGISGLVASGQVSQTTGAVPRLKVAADGSLAGTSTGGATSSETAITQWSWTLKPTAR
jgi:hypothetical protein